MFERMRSCRQVDVLERNLGIVAHESCPKHKSQSFGRVLARDNVILNRNILHRQQRVVDNMLGIIDANDATFFKVNVARTYECTVLKRNARSLVVNVTYNLGSALKGAILKLIVAVLSNVHHRVTLRILEVNVFEMKNDSIVHCRRKSIGQSKPSLEFWVFNTNDSSTARRGTDEKEMLVKQCIRRVKYLDLVLAARAHEIELREIARFVD
jgi:hypothetical protein